MCANVNKKKCAPNLNLYKVHSKIQISFAQIPKLRSKLAHICMQRSTKKNLRTHTWKKNRNLYKVQPKIPISLPKYSKVALLPVKNVNFHMCTKFNKNLHTHTWKNWNLYKVQPKIQITFASSKSWKNGQLHTFVCKVQQKLGEKLKLAHICVQTSTTNLHTYTLKKSRASHQDSFRQSESTEP